MRSACFAALAVGTASASMVPFCMYGSLRKNGHYYNLMKDCKEFGVTKTASNDFTLVEAGAFPHAIHHKRWGGGGKTQLVCEYFECPESSVAPLDSLEQCCSGVWYKKELVPLANGKSGWIYILPHEKQQRWLKGHKVVDHGDWVKFNHGEQGNGGKCTAEHCHA